MESISDVVDEVIQNCPIDVRRPLYKVWSFYCKINVIYLKININIIIMKHICSYHFTHYEKCELWIEIKFKLNKVPLLNEEYLIFAAFYFSKKGYL